MASFPIPLTFLAVDLEKEATIEVVVDMTGESTDLESLAEAVQIFASAASWGMFPGHTLGPTERPEVRLLPVRMQGLRFEQVIQVCGLHLGAYRVLLNILAQLHYDVSLLSAAHVRGIGTGVAFSFADVLGVGFPPPPAPLPFAVSQPEDLESIEDFVFRIHFAKREVPRIFPELEERLADWDSIVTLGGYLESFEESDLSFFPAGSSERFADTVEHHVTAFVAGQAAVDGFLNLLSRIHAELCPILRLEIE